MPIVAMQIKGANQSFYKTVAGAHLITSRHMQCYAYNNWSWSETDIYSLSQKKNITLK